MKTLTISNSGIQATMIVDYLRAQGIDARSRGSREYASIVTGGDMGRYEILVPDEQLEQAQKWLEQIELGNQNESVDESDWSLPSAARPDTTGALKKSVLFCAAGLVVLPIFNLFSIYYLYVYLVATPNWLKRVWISVVILALNASAAHFYLKFVLSSLIENFR